MPRINVIWLVLITVTGVCSILYLGSALFTGQAAPEAWKYFSLNQINAGRAYNQALSITYITGFLAQTLCLIWFLFTGKAANLSRWAEQARGGHWHSIVVFFGALWLILKIINLPFSFYSGYLSQHSWGFSTQTLASWWVDYLRSAGLDFILSGLGIIVLFWLIERWPSRWWIAGATLFSAWLFIQSFLWPILISPLFNKFIPARDPSVIQMVQELSRKANIPVDQILIMDASQRTTKANAYFAGLGKTKRIVLYDNLLKDYPLNEVKAVIAHEMAHWRQGHILKGLLLGILGNFLTWGILFLLIRAPGPVPKFYPPHTLAVVLLAISLLSFLSNPVENYFSRSMEKEADQVSLLLTGDVPSTVQLQVDLATKNLADIAPPPFIEWFSYSHPSTLERINNILKFKGEAYGDTR